MELSDRNRDILKAVVQSYINTAEPVGSRTVSKKFDFGLCSASIRNIMADLEEMGYLSQPYTSAGRIPTDKGYRFYVNNLDEESSVTIGERHREILVEEFRTRLASSDMNQLMQEASKVLSFMSHNLGIILAPKCGETIYRKIEFIKLKARRVLVVFITEEGIVQQRVIETEDEITQRDLVRIAEFLNAKLKGVPLKDVRRKIEEELREEEARYDRLVERALRLYNQILEMERAGEIYIWGMSEVFELPEFSDVTKIKRLFKAIEDKHTLINLLDRTMEAEGVRVFIGSENPCHEMQDCSMITSTYRGRERVIGIVGVIGPRRMDYREMISIVDYTAKFLSRVLRKG
jgi:heat-inducible transcriptional repressor